MRVSMSRADIFKLLPQTVWHADEPFFDSLDACPFIVLAEKTKPRATVVLERRRRRRCACLRVRPLRRLATARSALHENVRQSFSGRLALKYARWRHPAASRGGWDRMLRWLEKCRAMEASNPSSVSRRNGTLRCRRSARNCTATPCATRPKGCDAREELEGALLRARNAMSGGAPHETGKWNVKPGTLQHADLHIVIFPATCCTRSTACRWRMAWKCARRFWMSICSRWSAVAA